MQEDKPRTTKAKPQKIGKEHKRKANTRTKEEKQRQTRKRSLIRLTPHAHKSHTNHANHQDSTNPHNNPKTR